MSRTKEATSELEQRDRAMKVGQSSPWKRRDDGGLAIGPSNGGLSLEYIQNVAVKRTGATNIEAQSDREDSRPDLSSSDRIKHAGRYQWNHPAATDA